ncbi:MAG: hypothetical protein C0423_18845 [Methylibium sp.]|nr:hypothetical protein [Methylibium sp.]
MHEFHLPDMSCGHCVGAITQAVKAADAQAELDFKLAQHEVSIRSQLGREQLSEVLSEAGYPPAAAAA